MDDVDKKLEVIQELKRRQRENLSAAEKSFKDFLEGRVSEADTTVPVPIPTQVHTDKIIRHDTCFFFNISLIFDYNLLYFIF